VIDPEHVQALTEPFRRVSRASGGFGLGLSIVRSVAEAYGGTVELAAPAEVDSKCVYGCQWHVTRPV